MEEQAAHYTVLARRFRPQTFDDVIGQQHVAQALRNAIRNGRVAHAYLFTGARGVGKTSMARILAKALNCPNAVDAIPCNDCEICDGVSAGADVDVQEIDGASNRGIDDIRALRANVNVMSMRTQYKMYIIDEVHMLSKDAFNALLKTLEEPPANVKFVFCTTEPNKLPDTILSRCQRFDFATIEMQNIVGRLQHIATAEGYQVEPEALELVARRAAGSMRDSQSLFDQLLAFGEEHITAADVHRLLGTAGDDRLIALVDALIGQRSDVALAEFDRALADGVQLGEFVDQLLNYLRDLMVLAGGAEEVGLLAVSPANRGKLMDQAKSWGLQTIVAALQILAETKTRMFRVPFARALAELGLVRIGLLDDLESLSRLIADLKSGVLTAEVGKPATRPRPPAAPSPASPETASAKKNESPPGEVSPPQAEAPAVEIPRVAFSSGNEGEFWSQVVDHLDGVLKDHVKGISGIAISGPNQLELTFPRSYNFSKQYCERSESLGQLEELAAKVAGRPIRIACRVQAADESAVTESPGKTEEDNATRRPPDSVDDPFVQQAQSVFEATIVKVEGIGPGTSPEETS